MIKAEKTIISFGPWSGKYINTYKDLEDMQKKAELTDQNIEELRSRGWTIKEYSHDLYSAQYKLI